MTITTDDPRLGPLLEDPEVATFLSRIHGLTMLRHVPRRRLTGSGELNGRPVIVKIFGSPRARGNHRRLLALAAAGLSPLVPAGLEVSANGHVGLLSYRRGTTLDCVSDERFERAAFGVGRALSTLHTCGAILDREWTLADEIEQLTRRAPESVRDEVVAEAEAAMKFASTAGPVRLSPAHRDFHPRQVILGVDDEVSLIDLDDCALAPSGLDVGNMLAHLQREVVLGRRTQRVASAARELFLAGYGSVPPDLAHWERLALVRLAGLAQTRHENTAERDGLLQLLAAPDGAPPPRSAPPAVANLGSIVSTGHADRPVRIEEDPEGKIRVIKRYNLGNGAQVYEQMGELWRSQFGLGRPCGPGMPEPVGFDHSVGELTMAFVPGEALATRGTLGDALSQSRQVGRLLADLHLSAVELPRRRGKRALVRSTSRKVQERRNGVAGPWFADALHAISSAWTAPQEPAKLVPSHGDFSPRNVFASPRGLVLIDFDRLQASDPERDVAYWQAWLWVTAMTSTNPHQDAWALGDEFVASYTAAVGLDEQDFQNGLGVHQAVALVRIAHGWSSLRGDSEALRMVLTEAVRVSRQVTPRPGRGQ